MEALFDEDCLIIFLKVETVVKPF